MDRYKIRTQYYNESNKEPPYIDYTIDDRFCDYEKWLENIIIKNEKQIRYIETKNEQLRDLINNISVKLQNAHCGYFDKVQKAITDGMREIYCEEEK